MNKWFCAPLWFGMLLVGAVSAQADEIVLDWDSAEIGFFEQVGEDGSALDGLTYYVNGRRVASQDDFYAILPEFCANGLPGLLEFAAQIEGAPEVSLLKFQIDFNLPQDGEGVPYIARSVTIPLENGECPEVVR